MNVPKFRMWDGKEMLPNHEIKHYELGVLQGTSYKMMSSTGLLDKQGVEIYEGDIVVDFEGEMFISVYSNKPSISCFIHYEQYNIFKLTNDFRNIKTMYLCDLDIEQYHSVLLSKELDVIGNIYENPELLKRRKYRWKTKKIRLSHVNANLNIE